MRAERRPAPKIFISYSWDDEGHRAWVRRLAGDLRNHGLDILLDQWDVKPGSHIPAYMETSVREADYVVLVCTPKFAIKADKGRAGIGYEKAILTGALYRDPGISKKLIPLLRRGTPTRSIPSFLLGRAYIDVRSDDQYAAGLDRVLRHVHDDRSRSRVPGRRAARRSGAGAGRRASAFVIYCRRCGALAGQRTTCPGGASHDFVQGYREIYCQRCGLGIGTPLLCSGNRSHDFRQFLAPA